MIFSLSINVMSFYLFILFLSLYCYNDANSSNDDQNSVESEYHHHAILRRNEVIIFNNLNPEESKNKLSEIIDKMDLDHDGNIDLFELKSWIKVVLEDILKDDVESQWKEIVKEDAEKIDFQTYQKKVYQDGTDEGRERLRKLEERRWAAADLDKDSLLNKTELFRFIHPEEFKDLRPLLAKESLEEMDKDNNGFVDIDEYMADLFPKGREIKEEWIRHERQNFGIERDMNKDGYLDVEEVQNWLLPEHYDRVEAEVAHLMLRSGAEDKKVLTKKEILEKYDIFVGGRSNRPHKVFVGHEDL